MTLDWETPIEHIPNMLPLHSDMLKKNLGIFTVKDLVEHYPYKYIDKSKIFRCGEVHEGLPYVQMYGKIERIRIEGIGPKKRLMADLKDDSGSVKLVWFQSVEWLKKTLIEGAHYLAFGKPNKFGNQINISHPELKAVERIEDVSLVGFQSVYTTSESMKKKGLDSRGLSKWIGYCLKNLNPELLVEHFPQEILSQNQLMDYRSALIRIHFPQSTKDIEEAQRRLKFEEFFRIQIQLQSSLHTRKNKTKGYKLEKIDGVFLDFYNHHLPFELTNAQKRVLKDVRKDVLSGGQMNRLIQGDVGSGKTIVAVMSMLMAVSNGFQACLMAPTEILARQHFEGIRTLLMPLGLSVRLLTGSTKTAEKRKILDELMHGQIDIIIGTHALIEPTVKFRRLGMTVIDEQHRFGVEQRSKLWAKSELAPHVLVMTATPIPRTLAMTLYGDLDYSVINELPPGRKPITTRHVFYNKKSQLYQFVADEIAKGFQVYVVYPLIAESEKIDLKNLMDGYEELKQWFPEPKYQIEIVHGKMKPAEKEAGMKRFSSGEAQILVSTTVIEVGVNVPNATIMIIENAERFGLSQLHQLRGRVGRGGDHSYCFLMTEYNLNLDGRKRMETMVNTTDGFVIAEADLKMRGPGDISGTRQSGDVQLKLAHIGEDADILQLSQNVSKQIIESDPDLTHPKHKYLKTLIERLRKSSEIWGKIS